MRVCACGGGVCVCVCVCMCVWGSNFVWIVVCGVVAAEVQTVLSVLGAARPYYRLSVFRGLGVQAAVRDILSLFRSLLTLSLLEAKPGRFGRQVSVTDIYHTIPCVTHERKIPYNHTRIQAYVPTTAYALIIYANCYQYW